MITHHQPQQSVPQGPYSPATSWGDFIFTSGQGTFDIATGKKFLEADIGRQTEIALVNLENVLLGSGSDFQHILKITIFTTQIDKKDIINAAYQKKFAKNSPARTMVEVAKLPDGMLVEIEAIAVKAS